MASSNRMSVQKRQREQKKAERAAQKREERKSTPREERSTQVATASDLEGYGVSPPPFDRARKE